MTGLEAWSIISSNLNELMWYRKNHTNSVQPTYTQEEIQAEVICFTALKKLDEVNE